MYIPSKFGNPLDNLSTVEDEQELNPFDNYVDVTLWKYVASFWESMSHFGIFQVAPADRQPSSALSSKSNFNTYMKLNHLPTIWDHFAFSIASTDSKSNYISLWWFKMLFLWWE